jgi:hypothetical protein
MLKTYIYHQLPLTCFGVLLHHLQGDNCVTYSKTISILLNYAVFTQQTNNGCKLLQLVNKIVICTQRDGNNQIQKLHAFCYVAVKGTIYPAFLYCIATLPQANSL